MANDEHPTINDFLARLYTVQNDVSDRAYEEAKAITASNAAKGLLRSGATLKALAELIEKELDAALTEILQTLRHMKAVPGIDYQACRNQALLHARDLIPVLRGACELEKWIGVIGRGTAGDAIKKRVEALSTKIDYHFRQFDVGLDQLTAARPALASLAAPLVASLPQYQVAHKFQVALSFAGEQRSYVEEVASNLAAKGVKVFYDKFEENDLWGKDGAELFHRIYSQDAQYVVMFISADYVAKAWTRHERRAAISRQMKDDAEYILPVRFDASDVPGLSNTLQYLRANRFSPAELANEIIKKIDGSLRSGKMSDVPAPSSEVNSPVGIPIWRPTTIGVKAKIYLDVRSDDIEEIIAAVGNVGGVQSVKLDRAGTSRSIIAIQLPASAELIQLSIADGAIAAALKIDDTIRLES